MSPSLSSLRPVGGAQPSPVTVTCVDGSQAYSAVLQSRLGRDDRFAVRAETDPTAVLGSLDTTDCVVSVDRLPQMDGDEFLSEIRARDGRQPYVLVTGSKGDRIATAVRGRAYTAVVGKGTAATVTEYLADRIQTLLERRRIAEFARGGLAAAETVAAGVALTRSDGRFAYADQSFAAQLGYDTDALAGRSWQTVFTEAEVERIEGSRLSAVQDGWHWSGTCTAERADGSTVAVGTTVAGFGDGCLVFLLDAD